MLLVEITINSTTHYVSNEQLELDVLWRAEIASLSELQIKMDRCGGYVVPTWGSIDFLPSLFVNEWPPPEKCEIAIKHTTIHRVMMESDLAMESDLVMGSGTADGAISTLFTGTAHLVSIGEDAIIYDLYHEDIDFSIDGHIFNGPLSSELVGPCSLTDMNLTLVTTDARVPSPDVAYTTRNIIMIDEVDKVAQFYTHYFQVIDGTLTLVDLLATGHEKAITSFDIFEAEYSFARPYSKFQAGDFSIDGSSSYGGVWKTTERTSVQADAEAALANIKLVMERPEATFHMPLDDLPIIGMDVTYVDDQLEGGKSTTIRVQETTYDFDSETAIAKGMVIASS